MLAADVERFMSLAYAECPLDVRKSLAAQYFVDTVRDEDTQHSMRLMDAKDLKSALVYIMKAPEEGLKVSTPGGEKNGLYLELSIWDIPCLMLMDTDLEKNEIRIEEEEIPLLSVSVQHSKLCSVLAKERPIIPPPDNSQCFCTIQICCDGHFYQVSQKVVLVAATFIDLKWEIIPFRVMNSDNKFKTVDKGAVIVICEPEVDIVALPQEFLES
ncbi:transposon Ty3-I Gag-Pol polyprotein [Nephila pilipes]|uniref:Transposon Ty3-I Gag-Pol polyprotein n=1 Tax=Nephila pilipes TaxID=299642 RepID=A0A8X6Q7W2_NEPPI|nr:transposon Ty3-I Gag-Pol polyprotein [Nephila pilipes]